MSRLILIVDDEAIQHEVIGAALRHAGYRVEGTRKPEEALSCIQRHHASLVILDMDMPGRNGLQVLNDVRKESKVPVIMLTALDRSDLAVSALRQGAYDYLTKPVNFEKLLVTIEAALATAEVELDSGHIAHYQLGPEIGSGGMGTVFEALDLRLERKVAVKILQPELATEPLYELLFLREARAVAKLSTPGIVTVHEAGRDRGRLYMAMELVRGKNLRDILAAGKTFTPEETVEIGVKAAESLHTAHEAGLVHRDVKPANIILTPERHVKLLDFGLVQDAHIGGATSNVAFAGTPAYSAPEQSRGLAVDARADVYSLGVVLYELLTSERAFPGEDSSIVVGRVLLGQVARPLSEIPGVPPDLHDVITRMMAPHRDDRPGSMREVISRLGQAARRRTP